MQSLLDAYLNHKKTALIKAVFLLPRQRPVGKELTSPTGFLFDWSFNRFYKRRQFLLHFAFTETSL